jgi:hypothetical protein
VFGLGGGEFAKEAAIRQKAAQFGPGGKRTSSGDGTGAVTVEEKGTAASKVAKLLGISATTVRAAKRIAKEAPDLLSHRGRV